MKKFTVGIGSFQPHSHCDIYADGARSARWTYVNLYAPPGTKYGDTWCNGVKARQPKSKANEPTP